jgi:hypothetical protein
VLSVVGTFYFVFFTEESKGLKGLAFVLTGAGVVARFDFTDKVPFIVPLLLESAVALWMLIYWKLER